MNTTPITEALRYGGPCSRHEAAALIVHLSALISRSLLIDREQRVDAYTLLDQAADLLVPGSSDAEVSPERLARARAEHAMEIEEDERWASSSVN